MTPRIEAFLATRTTGEAQRLREDIAEVVEQRAELLALAHRVAGLNPKNPEIGAGMLASLHAEATRLVEGNR
mgnify:FL=1